jgi:cobalt-zinc-cadmium efflux system outer membrane protein
MNLFKSMAAVGILLTTALAGAQQAQPATLTIQQAEGLFFKNNFLLLAQQYDIDRAGAQVVQAKLYPNPEISADIIGYQGQNNIYFPKGQQNNLAVGLEQLILLGGKRKAQIALAKLDKQRAEAEFTDLSRNLQLQIWQSFFTLHNQQKIIGKYDRMLGKLDDLISGYELQVAKNNVALKDLVRLKSVYVKISNDKSEESAAMTQEQQRLNILLGITGPVQTLYAADDAQRFSSAIISFDDIAQKSLINRPDYKGAQLGAESAKINLSLQKKQVIPDVTLRLGYNQQGDAFNNQYNVGLGIPLPVFDRNQGNIQAARVYKEQQEKAISYKELEISNEALAAYQNYMRSVDEYRRIMKIVNQDFEAVFVGMNDNFRKGNVSMIEFADFFEAYNEAQTEMERVKKQLALAAAELNFVTATNNF